MHKHLLVLTFGLTTLGCASTAATTTDETSEAVEAAPEASTEAAPAPGPIGNFAAEEIAWAPFNPDKPDGLHVYPIKGNPYKGAFSALAKMPAGDKAPLHMHSAAYTGVTLTDGFVHGTSETDKKTLPAYSTWSQPAGGAHINACESETPCIFMVNFKGAVDMNPVETPTESGSNATVTMGSEIPWKNMRENMDKGPKMHVITGNPKEGAFDALIWLPGGMSTDVHTHSSAFAAAVISGTHQRGADATTLKTLGPGSVWHEASNSPHMEKCTGPEPCIFAISFDGPLDTNKVELKTE